MMTQECHRPEPPTPRPQVRGIHLLAVPSAPPKGKYVAPCATVRATPLPKNQGNAAPGPGARTRRCYNSMGGTRIVAVCHAPADTLSASEYESGSRWVREGTAHIASRRMSSSTGQCTRPRNQAGAAPVQQETPLQGCCSFATTSQPVTTRSDTDTKAAAPLCRALTGA